MTDLDEIIKEFVAESLEGLDEVDTELLKLEANPNDEGTLQSIFRTVHSMKGACGFLEFTVLEGVAHAGENLLDALREGELALTDTLITTLLEMNDAIRSLLGTIQETGTDTGAADFSTLVERMHSSLGQAEHADTPVPDITAKGGAAASSTSVGPASGPAVRASGKVKRAVPTQEVTTEPTAKAPTESSIRLRVEQLDALMNLAGELVLARNQVVHPRRRCRPRHGATAE